jgi:hypothetical protein
MNKTRIIISIIIGLLIGGLVNMGLIIISGSVVPLPEGVDPSNMESLKEGMKLFGAQHFIMPWLAHALGTLVGAFTATKIIHGKSHWPALIIASLFFIGGIMMVIDLPSPAWFNASDLILAYFPMGYLGYHWAK